MSMNAARFHIYAERTGLVLDAIKALMNDPDAERGGFSPDGPHFSWLNGVEPDKWETLADAMQDWRFPITTDEHGNVVDINFDGEKLGEERQMFAVIAPYVSDGSYVEMQGDGGEMWRWVFKGGECREITPQIKWED